MILGPLRSQLQSPPPCSWASPTPTSPYLALLQGFLAWIISQAQEGSPAASIPQGLLSLENPTTDSETRWSL